MKQKQIIGLVDSNLSTLDAAINLLNSLSSDLYIKVQQPYFESSLGKHLRHVLDHYLCFKRDLASGIIDYDQRHRDCQLETDKDYALSVCQNIRRFLQQLTVSYEAEHPLQVLMCNDVAMPAGEKTISSIGRELQFLQGHAVHHYALMATIMKLSGVEISADFGVAPSTIVHHKTVKATA